MILSIDIIYASIVGILILILIILNKKHIVVPNPNAGRTSSSALGETRNSSTSVKKQKIPLSVVASKLKNILKLVEDSVITIENIETFDSFDYEVIKHLAELSSNIFVISEAKDDEQELKIRASLNNALHDSIPQYKYLFFETTIGKIAILRQLKTQLHFDHNKDFCLSINKFIGKSIIIHEAGDDSIKKLSDFLLFDEQTVL